MYSVFRADSFKMLFATASFNEAKFWASIGYIVINSNGTQL